MSKAKENAINPFKMTSNIVDALPSQGAGGGGRNNVVVNRSFCYDSLGGFNPIAGAGL